jgi:uncharacterized iron-regulated membrane protein
MKTYTFWLKATIVFQLLTAGVHALSFLASPQPSSDAEKQMLDLMVNIKSDMGAGFSPSMMDLFLALSSCFSLVYLLGGLLNIQLLRKKVDAETMKGVLNINILVFGMSFIIMFFLTFLPPVILTGLVLALLIPSRVLIK